MSTRFDLYKAYNYFSYFDDWVWLYVSRKGEGVMAIVYQVAFQYDQDKDYSISLEGDSYYVKKKKESFTVIPEKDS